MRRDCGGKGGVIVNISSIAGLRAVSQLPVYSATKHAVVNFSRSFAVSALHRKILSKQNVSNNQNLLLPICQPIVDT